MTDEQSRAAYRVMARIMPREFRDIAGRGLEDAAVVCLRRERARFGLAGGALGWLGIFVDTVLTAIALRTHRSNARTGHQPQWLGDAPPPVARGHVEALMDDILKDFIYALRGLRRQPGFTLITILTLALGIGANTAIFSVVNGVLLRPLAYARPDQLLFVTSQFPGLGFDQFWMSVPEVLELRDNNQAFSSVGGYATGAVNLGTNPPTRPLAAAVTPGFMPTLGVPPMTGRWFNEADSRPGAEDVAILSWELWRRDYGGDLSVVGRKVIIDNVSTLIVGIMPPGYDIHDQKIEVWQPLTIDPKTLPNQRSSHFLYVVARLKDGVSRSQAHADVERMLNQWAVFAPQGAKHVPNTKTHRLRLDPLKDDIVGSVSRALIVLQGAVVFVLLIACANLANLLLARADSRQREFAVRAALGAARSRLLRQFITEGLVLSMVGATVGVGLAWGALQALLKINPDAIPRSADVSLDWRVLLFTLGLATLTGILFGLAPLFHLGSRLASSLRDGMRTTGTRLQKAVRSTLVVAEVTLAVMLVAGAGLLLKSFVKLLNVDSGFSRSHLVTFGLVPATGQGAGAVRAQQLVDLFNRLDDRLAALPGVQSVSTMAGLPPNRPVDANDTDFEWIPDSGTQPGQYPPQNVDYWQITTQHYVETMGIPIVKGRGFEQGDVTGAPVALVNETLVSRYFTDRDPIGQRIKPGFGEKLPWFTIVGVVKDVKQRGLDSATGTEVYWLNDQLPKTAGFSNQSMNVVVRTTLPLDSIAASIRRTVGDLDPSLPVDKLRTMDEVFGESLARPRFLTMLLGIFAGLALLLAAVGTYGVLSYLVSQRQQEVGIRMALGANRADVLRLVLRQGLTLAGAGLVVGVVGALAAGRLLRTLLFNVSPTDPMTIALVAGVIAIVAAAACLVPALRATRVDPLIVLRES